MSIYVSFLIYDGRPAVALAQNASVLQEPRRGPRSDHRGLKGRVHPGVGPPGATMISTPPPDESGDRGIERAIGRVFDLERKQDLERVSLLKK